MKDFIRYAISCALWVCIGSAAWADDLDIYLGTADASVTYNPNVLFIMDTSGSMTAYDNTSQSRMLRVQNALKDALQSATNINAGLMRFSDYGGPVLFPLRPIDDSINPEIITSTAESADDAVEISGSVDLTSNSLQLTSGTATVTTGLRYQEVNIPQGATITSATLRLTSTQLNTAASTLKIRGELSADSQAFASTSSNISKRATTGSEVEWSSDNGFPITDEIVTTPDFSAVIQEVVDQPGWCGGNALSLIIEGSSTNSASARRAKSADYGTTGSPQLVVTYDESTATGCISGESVYQVSGNENNAEEKNNGKQSTGTELTMNASSNAYLGMRFTNVNVPKGAVVSEAYLVFNGFEYHGGYASMKIQAAAVDDAVSFSPYTRYMLKNMPKTSGVTWTPPTFYYRYEYQTPNISGMLQEVFNRSGWNAGNDVMLILSDFVGDRGAYTYKGSQSRAPQLVIKFKGDATPGVTATVREHLISKVDELTASGYTPIVDTLYEATRYYGGLSVDYGLTRGNSNVSNSVRKNTRVSHRGSYVGADAVRGYGCDESNLSDSDCISEYIPSGAEYISPVSDLQCQTNNHIVLLSDGEANSNHSVSKIQSLLGANCSGSGGEKCGLDLVKNLSKAETSAIDRRVITHTIGFAANNNANNFLNQIALQSGGGFYQADNSADLVKAFQAILRSVKDVNATFVSPGVAVNQLNRLTHKDELYFALFKPSEGTIWPGNLKKYKISGETILDQKGKDAIDSSTGFFSDTSHSYWSTLADGNDVREGGAASQMTNNRNVYFFEDDPTIIHSLNELHENNLLITTNDLAISTVPGAVTLRSELLKWARGVDVRDADGDGSTSDVRLQMGDPIHSQPVIVNYSETESAIFVATNHGFLHSFDTQTGKENFAIIPKELLKNMYDFYQNNSTFNHIYGLDGDMVLRTVGNKTYLYVGMRRGGRNYYVFDVSSKTAPKLVFAIRGGDSGLEKLGQTWSRPTITKVKMGNTVKNVMIVGGGYSDDHDTKTTRSDDVIGNAVFMFDADNGSLLWSASDQNASVNVSQMKYSIPGRISVIDRDNDGFADHMYVADMGGQLFRFDIYNGKSGTDFIKGARIADLGGDTEQSNRRFFYGADVTEVALGEELYYGVAIGSGWRASPLDLVVNDRFYFLKDKGVFQTDSDGNYVLPPLYTESTLYDATESLLSSSDTTTQSLATSQFAGKAGWYIKLETEGEKALSSPLIIDYKIFFTTYVPSASSESACAPPSGNSRAYLVSMFNGNAVDDLNNNGDVDKKDRYAELKQTGIAPETKILIEEVVKPVVCLGTECASAVIDVDENGNEQQCLSGFACLAQNIFGRFERVLQDSWSTEKERQ
ncbi:PilC/PilY family type IV pilus protein [Aestuariibacter sp. A3R04]|uniref:PilC/PilY family type IV pilus protein n=1 Tax=Aestuariibacter sp. A3R04 TaxID=2841571 RepID=UPI001C08AA06|nr:PilC/PilY family type IV pilus protein [Aestuariibacter sp. A3R04]MBU3021861.1 pilus assembly protein PilY [Aestuariibacter sp. A3R04]